MVEGNRFITGDGREGKPTGQCEERRRHEQPTPWTPRPFSPLLFFAYTHTRFMLFARPPPYSAHPVSAAVLLCRARRVDLGEKPRQRRALSSYTSGIPRQTEPHHSLFLSLHLFCIVSSAQESHALLSVVLREYLAIVIARMIDVNGRLLKRQKFEGSRLI